MAAIIYANLSDSGTVTASSWIAAAPPSMVQNHHVSRRWKGQAGNAEWLLLDLGALTSIDTVAVFGIQGIFGDTQSNLSALALTRVRISTVDATGNAGNAHDSTSVAGRIRDSYGALVYLLTTPVSGRYVKIDISESTASAILAGRLVVGLRNLFTINFSFGWGFGYVDLSRKKKSAGGQTFIARDDRYRVLTASFETLVEADRYAFVHDADRLNGISQDVLFMINTASSQPDRDSVWGLMQDMTPPTQPNPSFFQKQYVIEERL